MKEDNIYFAGIFDGEGWFRIGRIKGHHHGMKREWSFYCEAALVIREKHIVEELCKLYGGTIRQEKPRKNTWSTTYKWRCSGNAAKRFAEIIFPWLRCKKKQAELLIKFQQEKTINGNKPLTDQRYEFYTSSFKEFSILNKKGIGKTLIVLTK